MTLIRKNNFYLFIFILIIPICAFSYDLPSLYIQKNGKILNLEEAIHESNGSIRHIRNSEFEIIVNKKTIIVDLRSEESINKMILTLFSNTKKTTLIFNSVQPLKQIFIDGDLNSSTDTKGNARLTQRYLELGQHSLELRKDNKVLEQVKINIEIPSTFECTGKKQMTCKKIIE